LPYTKKTEKDRETGKLPPRAV